MADKNRNNYKNEYRYLIEAEDCPFAITEGYKSLATNISFAIPQKENGMAKKIGIVSSISSEGKTTVSCNLAIAFAASGAKTLIIDCDLRKHDVLRYMKLKTKLGIMSYLSENYTVEDVILRNVLPNLDVLGCEKSAPNPAGLLSSNRFANLLKMLESNYDYIIIDMPPLGLVSDAMHVASKCDGCAVVVRSMSTTHKMLMQSISALEFGGCNILGFILKDSVESVKEYKKRYNYYSYYGQDKQTK